MAESTAMEALFAELLGDIAKVQQAISALPGDLDRVAEKFKEDLPFQDELTSGELTPNDVEHARAFKKIMESTSNECIAKYKEALEAHHTLLTEEMTQTHKRMKYYTLTAVIASVVSVSMMCVTVLIFAM